MESADSFLEVKFKNNKKMTIKNRLENNSRQDAESFLLKHSPYDFVQLEEKLTAEYRRMTLVDKLKCERVTIDLNLRFSHADESYCIPNLVILEVKRNRFAEKKLLPTSL